MTTARKKVFAAALAALPTVGCRDAVSPPPSSAISVSVKVSGVFPSDRFQIELDGRTMTLLANNPSFVVRSLPAGTHSVSLVSLPGNCFSEGPNPAKVETTSSNLSAVEFNLRCVAVTGAIAVSVTVSGNDAPLWFEAQVDTLSARTAVRGNGTTVFPGSFSGGAHLVKLSQWPNNCEPMGDPTVRVQVHTGAVALDTAVASFSVSCRSLEHAADTTASIVFERKGFLMLIHASGGDAVTLTPGERPAWSRDGKRISFQRLNCTPSYGCEHDLWLTSADGVDQKAFYSDENFDDYDAAIGPSGNDIAFVRFWSGPDQTYLAVGSLDGSSLRFLSMWYPYSGTSWSPNGTDIAFVCQGGNGTSLDLCLARTDRSCTTYFSNRCNWPEPLRLTMGVGAGDEFDPAFSPDGSRIAFTMSCFTGTGLPPSQVPCPAGVTFGDPYVAVLDLTTLAVTRLTPGHDPAWSHDGTQLLFVGNAGSPGLRVYTFADGSVRRLTDDSADTSPSWR